MEGENADLKLAAVVMAEKILEAGGKADSKDILDLLSQIR